MRFQLSPRARQDLNAIWRYGCDIWGRPRADKYVRDIDAFMAKLIKRPALGRSAGDVRPGYLKASIVSHVIFYRQTDSGIFVVRILHQSMDFQRHL